MPNGEDISQEVLTRAFDWLLKKHKNEDILNVYQKIQEGKNLSAPTHKTTTETTYNKYVLMLVNNWLIDTYRQTNRRIYHKIESLIPSPPFENREKQQNPIKTNEESTEQDEDKKNALATLQMTAKRILRTKTLIKSDKIEIAQKIQNRITAYIKESEKNEILQINNKKNKKSVIAHQIVSGWFNELTTHTSRQTNWTDSLTHELPSQEPSALDKTIAQELFKMAADELLNLSDVEIATIAATEERGDAQKIAQFFGVSNTTFSLTKKAVTKAIAHKFEHVKIESTNHNMLIEVIASLINGAKTEIIKRKPELEQILRKASSKDETICEVA